MRAGDRVALVNANNGRGVSAIVTAVKWRSRATRPSAHRTCRRHRSRDIRRLENRVPLLRFAEQRGLRLSPQPPRRRSRSRREIQRQPRLDCRQSLREHQRQRRACRIHFRGVRPRARDVVVRGNTILRCGWTPISVWSTSGLGGNIVVRDNHIQEVREAAIAVQGCDGVAIGGNVFASSTPPKQGVWITAEKTEHLRMPATNALPMFRRG